MVKKENEAGEDRVVVAVRLRPWVNPATGIPMPADRDRCVVQMREATAEVTEPRSKQLKGRFTYDHCFDSFNPQEEGFADQEAVFEALAPPLLRSAMDGYNVTVFAYGQTASGKSYTMLGTPDAPGFIPRFVDALYAAAHDEGGSSSSAGSTSHAVCTFEASYLEIHMEQIRDLLNPARLHQKGARPLRVREHPRTGPYVEDLAKVACTTSEQVEMLLDHGAAVRTVCATKLNIESSRSHAIFTLKLTQRLPPEPPETVGREKVSRVHLVDLAGSERAKRSGHDRIAETGAINRSLSTLGAVIHALAAGKHNAHVPYRESVLTYLLKDGLGGNARSVMLATISPSPADLNETLSTLRYADSAKNIMNHAKPNLDPSAQLVMQLRDEIDTLRAKLGTGGAGGPSDAKAIREQLRLSEKLMAEAQMTWGEKLRLAESLAEQRMNALASLEGRVNDLEERLRRSEEARVAVEEQRRVLEVELLQSSLANGHAPFASSGVPPPPTEEYEAWRRLEEALEVEEVDAEDSDGGEMPPEFSEVWYTAEGSKHRASNNETSKPSRNSVPAPAADAATTTAAADVASTSADAANDDTRLEPPPIGPPKPTDVWYSLLDEEGDEYYWNPATGVTQWELPGEAAVVLPAASEPPKPPASAAAQSSAAAASSSSAKNAQPSSSSRQHQQQYEPPDDGASSYGSFAPDTAAAVEADVMASAPMYATNPVGMALATGTAAAGWIERRLSQEQPAEEEDEEGKTRCLQSSPLARHALQPQHPPHRPPHNTSSRYRHWSSAALMRGCTCIAFQRLISRILQRQWERLRSSMSRTSPPSPKRQVLLRRRAKRKKRSTLTCSHARYISSQGASGRWRAYACSCSKPSR